MTTPDGTSDGWQGTPRRPQPRNDGTQGPVLHAHDQAALDELAQAMQQGRDASDARVEKVRSIFELASATPALDSASRSRLIEMTIAKLGSTGVGSGGPSRIADAAPLANANLTPDDEEAIDAWVLAGYRAARVPGSLRPRAEKLEAIGALLTSAGAMGGAERAALTNATLAKIDAAGTRSTIPFEQPRTSRARWSDLVSVAAMLALGAAVMYPVVGSARASSNQASCADALRQAASALASYANVSKGALPMATASIAGTPWWEVGTPERSNSANLYTLVAQKFVPARALACAGSGCGERACSRARERDWDCLDDVTYSYRVMFGGQNPTLSDPRLANPSQAVVLADASPVVRRAVKNQVIFPTENSANHGGRGQNALRLDGSTEWMPTPITASGDNIWLPRQLEQTLQQIARQLPPGSQALVQIHGWSGPTKAEPLHGTEIPADPNDAFVGP